MNGIRVLLSEIYFYELETREKVFNRLQLNFAIYISVITILAYMSRKADYGSNCIILTLFYVGLVTGIILISVSIYFTIKSLTGFKYKLFPRAQEVVKYGVDLKEYINSGIEKYRRTYQIEINLDEGINEYTIDVLAECIDVNSSINEYRRQGIRKSLWYMFLAAAPIIFSVFLFIVFDLDTSSPRKNMLIEDKNLAVQLDKLNNLFNTALTHRQAEEKPNMSDNDQSSQQNVQTQQPPKQPPSEPPKKPKPQMSTEDFHAPMDKSKLLNENGK